MMRTSAASSPLGVVRPRATTNNKGRSSRSLRQGGIVAQSSTEVAEQQKAVVVGAGPVGLASAAMLASRGWKVDVLERRADPTEHNAGGSIRTYPMAISEKGRRCLESVSVDIAEYLDGRPSTMLSRASRLVDWYSLDCAILACVRSSYPDNITFHWECGLGSADSIDLASRRLRLHQGCGRIGTSETGSGAGQDDEGTCSYDLLVGADGAGSLVRAALKDAGCLNSQVVLDARDGKQVYKTFHGLDPSLVDRFASMPGPDNSKGMKVEKFGKKKQLMLNFWVGNGTGLDRKMSVMAVASEATLEEATFEGIMRAADDDLPSEWIDAIIKQNATAKLNQFGRIIRNSSYAGPSAVLVGDAAHAVTSALGNGCNLGLGSVRALAAALDGRERQQPTSLQGALEDYSSSWIPEAHAFQRMEQLMATSMRSTLLGTLCKLAHLCSAAGGLLLRALAPSTYPSPLFVFWAGTPTLSYATMRRSYVGAAALGSGLIVGALSLLYSLAATALRAISGAL